MRCSKDDCKYLCRKAKNALSYANSSFLHKMKCFQRSKKCRSKHPPNTAASKPHTDKKHPTTMKARDSMLNQCYLKYNFCFTELRLKSQPLQNLKHQDHQEKFTSCLVIIWSFITAVIGNNSQWYFIFLKIQYLYFPHQSKRFIILFANDSLSNVADKTKKKKNQKSKTTLQHFLHKFDLNSYQCETDLHFWCAA